MKSRKLTLFSRRQVRSRYRLSKRNSTGRLRISCAKSNRYLYVQLIDDTKGHTLFAKSTLSSDFNEFFKGKFNRKNKEAAKHLGEFFAKKLLATGIKDNLIFDKGGYAYKGVIESLSESMRGAGLIF
ncbi:50S ribosomal protein L18 [Rickettsiales bacterium]|nr:50S ribosomal protein L18 [Rickettsiales bacterium]